jgi:hypothetical protein
VSQRLIPTGEQSGLQTHIATTENGSFVRADEKLPALIELESAICRRNGINGALEQKAV